MKIQNRDSVDDIAIPVAIIIPQGSTGDPTNDVVQFQFTPGGLPPRVQPDPAEWVDGFWLSDLGQHLACITVGPGSGVVLTPGRYTVWVKVIDNPTIPVEAVDVLIIS